MTGRKLLMGMAALVATAFCQAAIAQDYSALDRALGKPNPSAELISNFNELAASAANIGSVTPTEADHAAADGVRALLQDPNALARARDPNAQAAAQSGAEFQQIPALAARLDQSIGTRLTGDARGSMRRDFSAVAEYMAVVQPGSNWYCQIRPIGALVGC